MNKLFIFAVFSLFLVSMASALYVAHAVVDDPSPSPSVIRSTTGIGGSNSRAQAILDEDGTAPVIVKTGAQKSHSIIDPEDTTAPAISSSVQINGNIYTILSSATDASGISGMKIYLAHGLPQGQSGYALVKSCSSSPCFYTSGDNDGDYTYYATAADASPNHNTATSSPQTFYLPGNTNMPPAITSISGPSALSIGQTGTWAINAYDTNPLSMRALAPKFTCAIPASITAPVISNGGNGGTGGSGGSSAGGNYRTSTQVSATCAGQPSSIKVSYYVPTAPAALVEIFYLNAGKASKVFSQSVSGTSTLQFTAPSAGEYELHVSLGSDQSTASFSVPSCTPQTINTTQNITVNLAPLRELVLSKTVKYNGGFSKEFKVYKTTSGTDAEYSTEIALTYTNQGNSTRQNITIADAMPRQVVSATSQITFDNYPSALESAQGPQFSWDVKSVQSGGQVQFSYRFSRAITDAMIDAFAAPRVLAPGQTIRGTIAGIGAPAGGDLLAANVSFAGMSLPISLLAVAILALVLVALILLFVFGGKKEDE